MSAPELGRITRHNGMAGDYAYAVPVTYPGEATAVVTFLHSVYGGPVVMILASGVQTIVSDPSRFGTFGPEWVRRFFAE